ncbi:L-histidine N(alpha)-methyltransferase [Floridanema evergladense]|uniref:L-histidine N(Alpha)-methyltransferase n=1 Tax=Floridaenema evergladense BLCC-F167 TaxID=3153639 RepID=A0ABV4WT73_9CYAN
MTTTFLTVTKGQHQTLNKDGEDVIKGLTKSPKTLPPKYFYDHQGSQLFEQICELAEYYPTRTEASILREYSDEIAQITGACELVELGSGSSTKTRLLLNAYQAQNYSCKYVPIDVSESILKESVLQLQKEYPALQIKALVGTYEQAIAQLEPTSLPARMIFFLGNSIGNFSPQEYDIFLKEINDVLNPGDYFLLGIDLQKPREILEAAYNDSQGVTAAFNLNMLEHLNWRFQGNFDTNLFTHQAIYNQIENQIEMYLHCQKSHVVNLESLDLKIHWEAGESIRTEISRKFDLETVKKDLDSKGLTPLKIFTDSPKWFGLALCQVAK